MRRSAAKLNEMEFLSIRGPLYLAGAALACVGFGAAFCLLGCNQTLPSATHENAGAARTIDGPFRDAAEETGLIFRHVNGMSGKWYMPEHMGAGVSLFDCDNDGALGFFVVQGAALKPGETPDPAKGPRHRLFRNDLT